MGFYAQQNYPQPLGASNTVTISEAGCLLTSVSNGLLKMTGSAPDPATLNSFFIGHSAYSWDAADQANDDLTWGSISLYDPTIRLTKVGAGSLPDSGNAMVKFHYNSVHTGDPIDHYCWVDHIDGRDVYIIDSWDGLVKGPGGYQGVYHLPVTWATFERIPAGVTSTPAPTPASYQIIEAYPAGKQIQLNKDTNLWGMNYHFDFMATHPVETGHKQGEIWTVTNKVHHEDGYDYYRRDGQVDGFNVLDCDNYVVPPSAPPAGPVAVPSAYTPYWLRATIKWYPTALSARGDTNARGTIAQGNYLTYRADGGMLCLVKEKGGEQYWINPADNVEPTPTPEPVVAAPMPVAVAPVVATPVPETDKPKPSYHWLNEADRRPYRYRSTNTTPVPMKILEGNLPLNPVPAHWEGDVSMYTIVNNITYLLPDTTRKAGWMYGIPETILEEVKPTLDLNHNGISDVVEVAASWDKFADIIPRWVNKTAPVIVPKVRLATKQGRQVIDGFINVKKRKDKIQ